MKPSYQKHKGGYWPVVVFGDNSKFTRKINCQTPEMALRLAREIIETMDVEPTSLWLEV